MTETLSLSVLNDGLKHGPGTNVFLYETIDFTDTTTTLSNADIETLWPSKKVLSTNSAMITGSGSSLTGLPVLVKLTNDPDLSPTNVGSAGEGIRFTSDGTTLLDFEIEHYENVGGSAGTLTAWVEAPPLSASVDTYFYIHYGNDGSVYKIDSSSGVWDGQSTDAKTYVVVNHLDDAPTPSNDTDKEMIGSLLGDDDDFGTGNILSLIHI